MAKALGTAYYNLSTLLDAGVPVLRSLDVVAGGLQGRLQKAFSTVRQAIAKGNPLSDAMGMSPRVFRSLDVMIVRAAETSGNLSESFGELAKWLEFVRRINRCILSGMALPVLIIHFMAVLVPFPSLVFSHWDFVAYGRSVLWILAMFYVPAFTIIAIMRFTPQAGAARRALDRVSLRIPVLGKALYKLALSRYCRVFHMLCKAGMPMTQCVDMAMAGTGNTVVADLFKPAVASVRAGNPFSEGLALLPPEFIEPWRIGEETGQMDEVAKRLADANADAAEFRIKQFAIWLCRIVYFAIILTIAVIVIRFYLGFYGSLLRF